MISNFTVEEDLRKERGFGSAFFMQIYKFA